MPESSLPEAPVPAVPARDDFDDAELRIGWYAPRIDPASFTDLTARPGWLRMRGQESGTSLHKASILARKLTGLHGCAETRMDFTPLCPQHSAGLILYYDNMNFLYLRKYYSETLGQSALSVLELCNGEKREHPEARTPVEDGRDLFLRVMLDGRDVRFSWTYEGEAYREIGPVFDLSRLSDEYSDYGEFTGTMIGLACGDRMLHERTADFDFFTYLDEDA